MAKSKVYPRSRSSSSQEVKSTCKRSVQIWKFSYLLLIISIILLFTWLGILNSNNYSEDTKTNVIWASYFLNGIGSLIGVISLMICLSYGAPVGKYVGIGFMLAIVVPLFVLILGSMIF